MANVAANRVFIIQGALSILVAILAFFTLPDSPLKTRWLNQEERELAHARIYTDQTGRREATSVWTGLREAASDWRVWVFCLMDNLHLSANGFKVRQPSFCRGLKNNANMHRRRTSSLPSLRPWATARPSPWP